MKGNQITLPVGRVLGVEHIPLKAQLSIICISYREQMLISIKKCSHTALASVAISIKGWS